jgi:hypothetical protein
MTQVLSVFSILLWPIAAIAAFAGRHWLQTQIVGAVQHRFDQKLTVLRSDLEAGQEVLKSTLRDSENQIAALRSTVLARSAARQSLLDNRRFQAVERIWTAVNDLGKLKLLASFMARLNFKEMSKEADHPSMGQFIEVIGKMAPDVSTVKNVAINERPFVSEIAWAYFSAYTSILMFSMVQYQILRGRIKDAHKYVKDEAIKNIIKTALPHQVDFVNKYEPETYYFLLEDIESLLLQELKKILDGSEIDANDAQKAKKLLKAVDQAKIEDAENELSELTH